jgi:hypothetical protein
VFLASRKGVQIEQVDRMSQSFGKSSSSYNNNKPSSNIIVTTPTPLENPTGKQIGEQMTPNYSFVELPLRGGEHWTALQLCGMASWHRNMQQPSASILKLTHIRLGIVLLAPHEQIFRFQNVEAQFPEVFKQLVPPWISPCQQWHLIASCTTMQLLAPPMKCPELPSNQDGKWTRTRRPRERLREYQRGS